MLCWPGEQIMQSYSTPKKNPSNHIYPKQHPLHSFSPQDWLWGQYFSSCNLYFRGKTKNNRSCVFLFSLRATSNQSRTCAPY